MTLLLLWRTDEITHFHHIFGSKLPQCEFVLTTLIDYLIGMLVHSFEYFWKSRFDLFIFFFWYNAWPIVSVLLLKSWSEVLWRPLPMTSIRPQWLEFRSLYLLLTGTAPWQRSRLGPCPAKLRNVALRKKWSGIETSLLGTQQRSAKTPRAAVPNSTGCIDNAVMTFSHVTSKTKPPKGITFRIFFSFSLCCLKPTLLKFSWLYEEWPENWLPKKRRPPFNFFSQELLLPFCLR